MISNEIASRVYLYMTFLAQETPFGLEPNFAPDILPLLDIPVAELTEEQAEAIVLDAKTQLNQFFTKEAKSHGHES